MSGAELIPIGKGEGDLRFLIHLNGKHAGGITVHSVKDASFSYGVAIAPDMRGRGAASAGLMLLFETMKARGFSRAFVQIREDNAPSLALHQKLGFAKTGGANGVVHMERVL